ncbi:radical SAM protein [Kitasatospora sp. NPDC059408]|uniref:radical SAM protein n=1 Tax=Kitasatospora sp. NPDC059408 TaxID=3346823 RepID=UPI0036799AB4
MTVTIELPSAVVLTAPEWVELELTNKCQQECGHCFNESGPTVPHDVMALDDWTRVITECAELGVKGVQLIGGEPTTFPGWRDLVDHALSKGLLVEVFSNLFHITDKGWTTLSKPGVRLGTSYYSVNAGEHDKVTKVAGSHERTRANIVKALGLGIPVRAGVVRCHDGQLERLAVQELQALGVQRITLDDARGVGRAGNGETPTVDVLCGNCARGKLAILPDGAVSPCVIGRWMQPFNIRETSLRKVLLSPEWAAVAASIPKPKQRDACAPKDGSSCAPTGCAPLEYVPITMLGCPPNDSNDCSPASTEACGPSYYAPVDTAACPPDDSNDCSPASTEACGPKY